MALTDTAIRKTKPVDKAIRLTDGGGLYLLLNPNGSRWWRLDYRHLGKRKTLSMGTYPDTGLAVARSKRDEARKLLATGGYLPDQISLSSAQETMPEGKAA